MQHVIQTLLIFPKPIFNLKDLFSGTSCNLIYTNTYKCNMKYIGQTRRHLVDQFREHLKNITQQFDKPIPINFYSINYNKGQ